MSWFTQWLRKPSTSITPATRHEPALEPRDTRRRRQEPRLPAAEQMRVVPVSPVGARRR